MMYQREDWQLFRTLGTICQKAGVPINKLARLVAKELADNALDVAGACRFGRLPGGFFVEDDGPGIDGTDEEIAWLFSIRRPLASSKLPRLPTRGALGNGLRVVAATVLATGGSLIVSTWERTLRLTPQDDGTTLAERVGDWGGAGTRVEVRFGEPLADENDPLMWARAAVLLAGKGRTYKGKPSPHWYDAESFWVWCNAAGEQTVRDFVTGLDGCGGPVAGDIAKDFLGRAASSLTRGEAETLLTLAREQVEAPDEKRLGYVGKLDGFPGYGKFEGIFTVEHTRGRLRPEIPFVVEAWAKAADRPYVMLCVNRSPVTAEVTLHRQVKKRTDYTIYGCNLGYPFQIGRYDYTFLVNVQAPYMPITTDGKEPDLDPLADELIEAMAKAARAARRKARTAPDGTKPRTHKDVILAALPEAINQAGGDGAHRYSQRQLYYRVRPPFADVFGKDPDWDYFCQVITEHEADLKCDLPGIYRDCRGVLYHPHLRQEIPLGTLMVEQYKRPAWTFNKILYCEKEGFFPLLRDARWPERHDCALLTSKGFASRAARDVLDLLGETDEPLTFYCIHDADGYGTTIYDALQEGTTARGRRKFPVINLGLEPEEALKMGLPVETFERKERAVAVGGYVTDPWREWLQTHRIELNEMTTPRFLHWLDCKMEDKPGKLIPSPAVLSEQLAAETRQLLREEIIAEVLRSANVDRRVEDLLAALAPLIEKRVRTLEAFVTGRLAGDPAQMWKAPIQEIADELVATRVRRGNR